MSTTVAKTIDCLLGPPSVARGLLWSLTLHATAIAATCGWWSSSTVPRSFAGDRHVMQSQALQIVATLASAPVETEHDTLVELEATLPLPQPDVDEIESVVVPVTNSSTELSHFTLELAIARPPLPEAPVARSEESHNDPADVPPSSAIPPATTPHESEPGKTKPRETKPHETELAQTPKDKLPPPPPPPTPATAAVEQQLAGVEEQVPPDLSGNRPPSYPEEAIRKRLEGVVLLRVYIAASGQVERVEISRSSGHAILDRTAVGAVGTWRASPARQAGAAVATVEILPIHFRL